MVASENELRGVARLARESVVVANAVTLARWIGTGRRPVTAGQVLRKADIPAAGAALGVEVPPRPRTMADIRALHRPWRVAVATGLLQVGGGWVTGGPALGHWPPADADLLAGWLAALCAVCAAESFPQEEDSVRLPAAEMIAEAARFSDLEQRDHVAWGWLAERQPAEAAREILAAAEGMSALLRSVAVGVAERLGQDTLPAWRELTAAPRVGPHARAVLAAWDQGPEPSDADWRWLAVEAAAAALEDKGPDEALSRIWESMPGTDLDTRLAKVRATGHPDAAKLAQALAEFAASGAPNSIDQVAELKVSLPGSRPLIWRRVRLPLTATLGDLHDAIQVLFGWDGDHLHVFQAGKEQYSDPFANLDETGDELAVRVRDVLAPGGKISYTYDLGACWEHEITLEKVMPRDPGQDYPVCVGYKGDSPVEYWSEDDPEEPEPFNLAEVNRRLAALGETGE